MVPDRPGFEVVDAGIPGAHGVFSTGGGGTNLSLKVDDETGRTLMARDLLARAVGRTDRQTAWAQQVHGAGVAVVRAPLSARARTRGLPDVDALVTADPDVALAVVAADCMPVLLAAAGGAGHGDDVGDAGAVGVVGVAHAGRPGLVAGVLPATVAAMRDLGAGPVTAVVGPCIGGCCYELPEELADAVAAVVPAARSTTTWGTPSIDLRSGADAVLHELGVEVRHVGGCTYEQPGRFHSYRRDRTAARHGGIVTRA